MGDKYDDKAREVAQAIVDLLSARPLASEISRMLPALSSALRSAADEEREECAKIVEAEAEWILSRQDGRCDTVDLNLRMIAVKLPDLASSIRSRGNSNG